MRVGGLFDVSVAARSVLLALLMVGCADTPIEFDPPDDAEPRRLLESPPLLRSPFASGSARVTSHVTHRGRSGLVDYDCNGITRRGHRGTDFGVPVGTPILAAAAGEVVRRADGCAVGAGRCGGGFGNQVVLLHADGRATLYAHLKSGSGIPTVGTMVSCGDRIGASGNTGRSSGPHLHFEVRDGVSGANQYFARPHVDPWGGACSSQTAALWADGTPGPTCDGAEAPPRDGASFADASHPSRVTARPGDTIAQRWTLTNTGTTTWTRDGGYQLTHVNGPDFGRAAPIALSVPDVAPGDTAAFDLPATVPSASGLHRGEWRMANADGLFGDVVFLEVESRAPASPGGCASRTLGREVPDGTCVQVDYPGCGVDECAWYMCRDGAYLCVDAAQCEGERTPSAACPEVGECGAEGETCEEDVDCCGADGTVRCLLGFCAETAGCGFQRAPCSVRDDCCGQIVCRPDTSGANACCLRVTDPCAEDSDCCGAMTCTGGRCACREAGQSCASHSDCCGGSICNDGTCGF